MTPLDDRRADPDQIFLEYVLPGQPRRRAPLSQAWNVRFEQSCPIVDPPSGGPTVAASWVFSKTGTSVRYESGRKREQLMWLDFDRHVAAVACRPFRIEWPTAGGAPRGHAPDYFARLTDDTVLVLDVPAAGKPGRKAAEVAAMMPAVCATVGWRYQHTVPLAPVLAANLRWLTGYRLGFCRQPAIAQALIRAFGVSQELLTGVRPIGEPMAVLPVAYHLLWSGELVADLESSLLSMSTTVTAGHR